MANLLYNHSCYSLLESTIRIKDLVGFCAENGYKTVSLCDRNVMYGYKYLTEECKKAALKPLYGLQIEISVDEYTCSYVLYAVNNEGYKLLMRISTYINAGNKLTINDLKLLSDDVVVISIESESGYLERCLRSDREKLEQLLEIYRSIRHFYIGLEAGKSRYIRDLNILLTDFCRSSNLRYVAMPLALWKGREDYESYQIVTAIRNQTTLDDQNLRFRSECHLRTQEELFNDFDSEAIGNTNVIADMCNVDLDQIPVATLPKFPCPNGASSESYLKSLTVAGLRKRFGSDQIPESYYRRLKYELKVILEMGFADYFLIIWDIILYCHRNNIYVGFGRGSSAGSLVAYCLGITQIDPLKHNLIFERFLNPERITMPDIDIDFPDDRRQEVIEYISRQYGQDRVAHIITFTTFGCRQALIDSCKVHSLSESKTKLLIKSLSRGSDITIAEEMQKNNQFRRAVKSDPEYDKIVSGAIKIEGLPRQTSMHAAGIVISNDRLIAHIPLIRNDEQGNLTQYTMEFLENMGLIKIDILGLSNLAVTSRIIEEVRKDCGITSYRFPLDDEKTYRLFAGGDTSGIFQFESEGIRKLLRNMRPACFEDLCIAIALYRPGPMDNIPLYLENRKHPERITYVNERIREILAPTSGIMIYQEQIMKITQIVAGFSLGKADILRKAVSKKNEEQMQSLREEFLEGAVNNGYRIDEARSIFDQIERFANYGFNKAHSVVYASLSYQQAYLKANYPLQFYQQMLNSVSGNLKKTSEYILECRRKGIGILPPDINRSALEYVREGNNIRYPLSGIKDISRTQLSSLLKEREENGEYADFYDFITRAYVINARKEFIEQLIRAGTLDEFGYSRNTLLHNLSKYLRYCEAITVENDGQRRIIPELLSRPIMSAFIDDDRIENTKLDYTMLGVYLKGHPVEKYREIYQDCWTIDKVRNYRGEVRLLGLIRSIREIRTRRGEPMAFVECSDEMDSISLAFMPRTYETYRSHLKTGSVIYVEGVIDERESVKVNRAEIMN